MATLSDSPEPTAGRIGLALRHSVLAATDAVDMAFTAAGAGAVYDDHPLQRCFRDLHTAAQHVMFNADWMKGWARDRFAAVASTDPTGA